ncbi:DUF1648 domain-containing protein [Streptomyces sp. NPDC049590]|uniref:DUF1648 domain-containing protein n=1 Tax=Streptomyces sp. NPDC049590 TaxID=3154834 RepID=UPI0034182273
MRRAETGPASRGGTARWRSTGAVVGVTAVLAGLPLAVQGRLPGRLATHWSAGGSPDGSLPLWAAALVPAGVWLLTVLATSVRRRDTDPAARSWRPMALAPTGAVLVGAQVSIVLANLGRTDWHRARQPVLAVVLLGVLAALAAVAAWRFAPRPAAVPAAAPVLEVPEGERLVWFSRAANSWLRLLAAVGVLVAGVALVALAFGLADPATLWPVFVCSAVVAIAVATFSSVQAKVSEAGLEVSFGPLGWPVRRWSPAAIESARAERRRPAQVGGWGYRISGLGTTVMLRAGECLVIRPRGRRSDFAVSVDDAERGAALLNTLRARLSTD